MACKTKIKVKGHLDKKWKDWFEGLDITHKKDTSILSGNMRDDAFLYGILLKLRDLNLTLISINPAKERQNKKVINN